MLSHAQDVGRTFAQDEARAVDLEAVAANLVGRLDLDGTRMRLCRAMLREALRRTRGNYTQAAVLLGVRRQAVQQMVRRWDLEAWAADLKRSRRADHAVVRLVSKPGDP